MKKNFIIAAIMLFATLTATAQYKDFYFGLKTGTDLQWAGSSTKTVHNDKVKMGYNIGFVAEYYFVENYAIEFGLNLNLLRNRYDYEEARKVNLDIENPALYNLVNPVDSIWGNVNRTMRGTYVELPIMLKMRTNEFGDWRFFGEVGAAVGVRCKASAKDVFTYTPKGNPVLSLLDNKEYSDPADSDDAVFTNVTRQYNPLAVKYIIAGGAEYSINGNTRVFARIIFNGNFLNALSLSYAKGDTEKDKNKTYDYIRPAKLDVHPYSIGIDLGIMF